MKYGQLIQYIKPTGETIHLNSLPSRAVKNMTGWGMVLADRNVVKGPYQHGNTLLSYRFQPRTISMELLWKGCSRSEWHTERTKLINRLGIHTTNPNLPVLGVLRWEYIENGTYKTRDLTCSLNSGLGYEPLGTGWHEWGIIESLEFLANDPIIFDPTVTTITFDTFTDHLILPFAFPFLLGTGDSTSIISYDGTWLEHPIIEIDGPTNGFAIENESTGVIIYLDYQINDGVTVTIDLSVNDRSVTDSLGNNLISFIKNSNLAEFALEADPTLADGLNTVTVYVKEYTANTEVRILYNDRYIGI